MQREQDGRAHRRAGGGLGGPSGERALVRRARRVARNASKGAPARGKEALAGRARYSATRAPRSAKYV